MKKLTILIVLLVSFSFVSEAQMNFGVKAGLNMATLSGDNTDDAELMPGYQVGLVTNFNMGDAFTIQPGLILAGKGSNFSTEMMGETFDQSISLNYLEIPINAVYNVSDFQIFAGPYLGFGLFGKVKFDADELDDSDIEFTSDVDEETEDVPVNSLDYGLNIGAGYMINESIQIQAGYGLGLGNINPKYNGEDPEDNTTNSVIQLSVAYFL